MEQRRSTNQNHTADYYLSSVNLLFILSLPLLVPFLPVFPHTSAEPHEDFISPEIQHGFNRHVQNNVQSNCLTFDLSGVLSCRVSGDRVKFSLFPVVFAVLREAFKGRRLISPMGTLPLSSLIRSEVRWRVAVQRDRDVSSPSQEVFYFPSEITTCHPFFSQILPWIYLLSFRFPRFCPVFRSLSLFLQFLLLRFPWISHCGAQGPEGAEKNPLEFTIFKRDTHAQTPSRHIETNTETHTHTCTYAGTTLPLSSPSHVCSSEYTRSRVITSACVREREGAEREKEEDEEEEKCLIDWHLNMLKKIKSTDVN